VCTVTYLPISNNSYLLTHNRDEKSVRKQAIYPKRYKVNGVVMYYPKDAEANGTWIAMSGCAFSLCLLNGGFEAHNSTPPYAKSRGQIILDFFKFKNVNKMCAEYDFTNIEPFTLIVVMQLNKILSLNEMVWDGVQIHNTALDTTQPQMWSSSTLYTPEDRIARKEWFKNWLANNKHYTQKDIVQFHHYHPQNGTQEGLIINRNDGEKLTVSLTSIENLDNEQCTIYYKDFLNNKDYRSKIFK
jgi:Transport and Golgi organisation 2